MDISWPCLVPFVLLRILTTTDIKEWPNSFVLMASVIASLVLVFYLFFFHLYRFCISTLAFIFFSFFFSFCMFSHMIISVSSPHLPYNFLFFSFFFFLYQISSFTLLLFFMLCSLFSKFSINYSLLIFQFYFILFFLCFCFCFNFFLLNLFLFTESIFIFCFFFTSFSPGSSF